MWNIPNHWNSFYSVLHNKWMVWGLMGNNYEKYLHGACGALSNHGSNKNMLTQTQQPTHSNQNTWLKHKQADVQIINFQWFLWWFSSLECIQIICTLLVTWLYLKFTKIFANVHFEHFSKIPKFVPIVWLHLKSMFFLLSRNKLRTKLKINNSTGGFKNMKTKGKDTPSWNVSLPKT